MHLLLTRPAIASGLFLIFLVSAGRAENSENWPRRRGPHDDGVGQSGRYPAQWDAKTNLLWQAELPGKGCSTPIVWDQRIVLTAPASDQDAALVFDWSGKRLWQTALGPQRKGRHRNGSGCNPSPATDGRQIFVYFKSGTLAALDWTGKILWKANLQKYYEKDTLFWDVGTSPVLTERDVVVAVMHHGPSFLAAFDKRSGELDWKVARQYCTPLEGDHSYATPLVFRHQGREALLVWGGERLTAHDAADGRLIWSCGNFNPDAHANWVAVASPVIAGAMAVVPYGRGERLHGIRLGGNGDVTATHRAWVRDDTGAFVTTPAEYEGRVYLLRDRGEVECVDPANGKTISKGQLPKKSSNYYASPVIADGKLYAAREDGVVFVVSLDGRYTVLGQNDLGERIIASPVPVAGRLLLRGEKHLFCIDHGR